MWFEASVGGRSVRVEVQGGDGRYSVRLEGRALEVDWLEGRPELCSLIIAGRSYEVGLDRRGSRYTVLLREGSFRVTLADASGAGPPLRKAVVGPARISAPMPGKIVRLLHAVGEPVAAGEGLVVMEAMKMENELRSPRDGHVRELAVSEGQAVESGALLAVVE